MHSLFRHLTQLTPPPTTLSSSPPRHDRHCVCRVWWEGARAIAALHDPLFSVTPTHALSSLYTSPPRAWGPESHVTAAGAKPCYECNGSRVSSSQYNQCNTNWRTETPPGSELALPYYIPSIPPPYNLLLLLLTTYLLLTYPASLLHCYPLGCQFEPRCGRGFRRVMPYAV